MASVLLVIDMQVGVLRSCDRADEALRATAALLAKARAAAVPVVYVQHEADNLSHGSRMWQVAAEVAPLPDEPRVYKRYRDGFAATDLKQVLETAFADVAPAGSETRKELVIVGAKSNNCVWTTTTRALVEGYDVVLVSDAHTTSGLDLPAGSVSGAQLSDSVSDYFTYAGKAADGGYPGRHIQVLTAAEVEF
ncbi:MAG: isochorismatase family protein [Propionibacteriaceae bacterium]|jgi:nicotinamidase-related amidase|nr:isochorismatase family protein [Propionibacteriaceae bacterium]